MTSPNTGMPLLTIDSAWRQWRNAKATHATLKAREEASPLTDGYARDTNKAAENEQQARAVWLTTMLEYFERRRQDAIDSQRPAKTPKELKALALPCADCLTVTTDRDVTHKVNQDETKLFPVWATCGRDPIDPTVVEMPKW